MTHHSRGRGRRRYRRQVDPLDDMSVAVRIVDAMVNQLVGGFVAVCLAAWRLASFLASSLYNGLRRDGRPPA